MFKPKAIAVDIDGTLTDRKRALNCRAVEALRKVKIPVILATGNISCFARAAAKLIGVSDVVICENGGVVRFEYDGEDIVLGDKEKCVEAVRVLEKHFEVELLDFEYRKSEVCMRRSFDINEARKLIDGMGVKLVDSGFAYHIMDADVSKGKALKFVAERLGISSAEFAVIGDSENDIDMFRVAGFGIAVANADERLKEYADLVTPSPDGEGVVEALQFLGLLR
ncbi:MAG: Phosphoglycolate phosphatase [Archaeoglobus fulgidus]|uniref:Phosphoglycolate phosphatase n=1 Tax=Archaeoglobus fulgidus TaxID=2234 RepID=A0A117KLB7_ARCFL|nr:phosphoglycolate phosphatase [Archaeoglobus fulgidus]KUJ92445.1 MAG: Phosphoglycolate phosphatase [Archaeoglobus fulgidus]KUK05421.1 MAG: Phosphoglycolate phosphatase [Archaeoglobus fulgidus]